MTKLFVFRFKTFCLKTPSFTAQTYCHPVSCDDESLLFLKARVVSQAFVAGWVECTQTTLMKTENPFTKHAEDSSGSCPPRRDCSDPSWGIQTTFSTLSSVKVCILTAVKIFGRSLFPYNGFGKMREGGGNAFCRCGSRPEIKQDDHLRYWG